MKITKQQLIEFKACESGLARFVGQTNNTDSDVDVDVASLVGGKNTRSDILWLCRKMSVPKQRIVRFVCDCALINIERIKPYTDKYDLIVDYLNNPESSDRSAAAAAAAADAADVAAYAAAAAVAADAAAAAADAAAAYAAAAAAADAAYEVNQLLIDLVNEF